MTLARAKVNLKEMFDVGIKAVLPHVIIENQIKIKRNKLFIGDNAFFIEQNVYLVGFGKAVMSMAIALERILSNHLKRGIISVPRGSQERIWKCRSIANFPKLSTLIEYREGSTDNQPDAQSLAATNDIIDMVKKLNENDTLIVLISGGGSALFCMPKPFLKLWEKQELCKKLQNAGADITELNTVRKKLSMVKGGGLACMAYPASVISLILSDIINDPVDLIASGPTVYSTKLPQDIVNILKKYNLYDSLEENLKTLINSKEVNNDKILLNENKQFKHVNNVIIGNNVVALEAVSREALKKGLNPIILRDDVRGHVHDVSLAYTKMASLVCLALQKHLKREDFYAEVQEDSIIPLSRSKVDEIYNMIDDFNGQAIVLIGGGEPTVVVTGNRKGGRNQELALYFSLDWFAKIKEDSRLAEFDVIMFSGGTDGQDGPTDAAGAFGYPEIDPIMYDLRKKLKTSFTKAMTKKMSEELSNQLVLKQISDLCEKQDIDTANSASAQELEQSIDNKMLQENIVCNINTLNNRSNDMNTIMLKMMEFERMIPQNALKNNDTYNFYSRFKRGQDLVKTGLTGTNVMDLHFIHIKKRQCSCQINYTEGTIYSDPFHEHDLDVELYSS